MCGFKGFRVVGFGHRVIGFRTRRCVVLRVFRGLGFRV